MAERGGVVDQYDAGSVVQDSNRYATFLLHNKQATSSEINTTTRPRGCL